VGTKRYKPTSPGRRRASVLDYSHLTKKEPEKSLLEPLKKTGGRNNRGRVTCRFRGGGNRRMYRVIDFRRDKEDVPATVTALEYDPNRSADIALLEYADGERRYIIAPKDLRPGDTVISGEKVEPKVGNCMPLENIPTGMVIHCVELYPGRGAKMARGAGAHCQLMAKEGRYATLQMPSGEVRKVNLRCRATIGQVGNLDWRNVRLGKAGRMRHRGRRPHVRGSAMNPVAHPMGGGEGRRSGGRHPVSPWGQVAKGGKTRNPRNPTNKFIIRRSRQKKRR